MGRKDIPAHSSITLSTLSAQSENPKWILIPKIPDKYRDQIYEVRKQYLYSGFSEQSSTWIREQILHFTMGIRAHVTPHPLACSHGAVVDICAQVCWEIQIFPYPVTKLPSCCSKCHWLRHARWACEETPHKGSHSQTYCPLLPKRSKSCITTSHKPVE